MRATLGWTLLGHLLLLLAPRAAAAAPPAVPAASLGATCSVYAYPLVEHRPGAQITFQFDLRNSWQNTRRFIYVVDSVGVFSTDLDTGQSASIHVQLAAGVATQRLHPRAWCAEFDLGFQPAEAEALLTAANAQFVQASALKSTHSALRSMIRATELDAVAAVRAKDGAAAKALLEEIQALEQESDALLQQIEGSVGAFVSIFGRYPEAGSAVIYLKLRAFDRDLRQLSDALKESQGMRMHVNADDDDRNEKIDRTEQPAAGIPGENDLVPFMHFFARPVDPVYPAMVPAPLHLPMVLREEQTSFPKIYELYGMPDKSETASIPPAQFIAHHRGLFYQEGRSPSGGPAGADQPEQDRVVLEFGDAQDKSRVRCSDLKFRVIPGDDNTQPFADLDVDAGRGLRIARWLDAVANNAVKVDFTALDADRFRLQLVDRPNQGAGTVDIRLKTENKHGGVVANVNPYVTITLTENPAGSGIFETQDKNLFLMGDAKDDDFVNASTGGVADDQPGDLTFLAMKKGLRGDINNRVVVEHKVANKPCLAVAPVWDVQAPLPVKTAEVHLIVPQLLDPLEPLDSQTVIDDIQSLNERFAQAGVQFKLIRTDSIAQPQNVVVGTNAAGDILKSVDLSDGLDEHQDGPDNSTEEERALILGARAAAGCAGPGGAAPDHVDVILVNHFLFAGVISNTAGASWPENDLTLDLPMDFKRLKNAVIVVRDADVKGTVTTLRDPGVGRFNRRSYTVTPHEAGHLLQNSVGHPPPFADSLPNLMDERNANRKNFTKGQRLDVPQRDLMRTRAPSLVQ